MVGVEWVGRNGGVIDGIGVGGTVWGEWSDMVVKGDVTVPISLHSHASNVPVLTGSNFSKWSEHVQFTLGVLDLDMALLVAKPVDITDESTKAQVNHFNNWERSNRLSLMFMKMTIANNIKTSLPQESTALEYLNAVEDRFKSADKSLAGTIMAELTTMKCDGSHGVQEHILNMANKAAKLATLGMKADESFPCAVYTQLTPKKEEVRLREEGHHTALAVTQVAMKKKGKAKKYPPKKVSGPGESSQAHGDNSFTVKCYFCGKKGHVKKDCNKHKAWFEKKGKNLSFVCYESNLVEVPSNTWWIDYGATTHITNSLQGYLSTRKPGESDRFVYMGNRLKAEVLAVGTYRLVLETGHQINLEDTFYVPSISRNLVSLSRLDCSGYSVSFGCRKLNLMFNSIMVGSGDLCDGLYKITLNHEFAQSLVTLHLDVGSKRSRTNEKSFTLWHKRLGHISKDRIQRLVKNGISEDLDFTNSETCVDCIKESKPNTQRKKYFITFIDDFSCYGYVHLIHEKSQALDILEVYITEVERQLDRKVKIVRSDRGGEFYGRYDESGQNPGPFAKFLEKRGIRAQYTMPGTP
ncbi:hypothetical protein Vadar_024998 [Vaccinium darrowii]|uniref:Uncharacterized protein n=1 Tax=Vaccinium darrowii TaxID=229202 RepID=A0ACB7ZLE1_9ERIC|nr:hypothetical protein Vadar_024998 [Vaccinium darrowii]